MSEANTHHSITRPRVTPFSPIRMLFWLALVVGVAAAALVHGRGAGQVVLGRVPHRSRQRRRSLADNLRRHVAAVASREHNVINKPAELEAAARHIEFALFGSGYGVETQRFPVDRGEARNIEVEVPGGARASEIIVVGAHYDSVTGAPGRERQRLGRRGAAGARAAPAATRSRRARCASSRS